MDDIKSRFSRSPAASRPLFASASRPNFNQQFSQASAPFNPAQDLTSNQASGKPPKKKRSIKKPKWPEIRHFRQKFKKITRQYRFSSRMAAAGFSMVMIASVIAQVAEPAVTLNKYDLSKVDGKILSRPIDHYASKLTMDSKTGTFQFNAGYSAASGEVAGQSYSPKITASFAGDKNKNAVQVNDPVNNVGITFKPRFRVDDPRKDRNRVVYPIKGKNASNVYTLKGSGVKEDIILHSFSKEELSFEYDVELPENLEIRMENDGSIGVYGPSSTLLGNVSTGTEKDAELLQKARANAEKNNLIFRIPAPFIKELKSKTTSARTWYELKDKRLIIHANQLDKASYPLSIDPTVYVESAAKLMRGNNESNVDFDVDNELIQKSQTTGARIDAWQGTVDMNTPTWNHATAAAGGYVYRAGGITGNSKPQVVGQQRTLDGSNGTSFTMSMPSVRPAGDLYIAIMCYNGSTDNAITAPAGGGWTEYADEQGHAAYYKVGDNVSGGNEAASYQWTGPNEEYAGVIIRVTNFDTGNPIGSSIPLESFGGSGAPIFPAVTPTNSNSLIVRGAGWDTDDPSDTGWVPAGHTKIDSESSSNGGTGSCGFAAATMDTPPAGGVSTGTQAMAAGSNINDDWGASGIAINPISVPTATVDSVYWAHFNQNTKEIDSPNPGNGTCSGWCTNSAYNLPDERAAMSMIAYNGYLYVMGGLDSGGTRQSTIYIAKLGANGEPQKWHPTDTNKNNWDYWYTSNLNGSTARSYFSAYAYNNRIYVLGGQTNASPGGVTTVEIADITPNGTLGSWSSGTALPSARHGHTVHVYNDTMYLIGGNSGTTTGTLQNSVYYSKLASNGTMGSWLQTNSFTTPRSTHGGAFTAVWGAYIYLGGGCTAINGSGYCTTIASDTQLASINADGSLAPWSSITNLTNDRIGYTFIAWQDGLYRLGGCSEQNSTTGVCATTLSDVDYGEINQDGDASTVDNSEPSGSGQCITPNYTNCDLPPAGDNAGQGGQMSSMVVINNGYIYNIGGCTSPGSSCTGMSGNTSYAAISSTGALVAPPSCSGTSYGLWCVDSTNRINGTAGVGAGAATVFNNTIYVIGGTNSSSWNSNIYRVTVNTNGSLSGAWSAAQSLNSVGLSGTADDARGYLYAFTRANPSSAGTNPGNLYLLGGCSGTGGIGCSTYFDETIKCNIATSGAINGCTLTGQLQIDADNINGGTQGLGLMAGTIYANRIYLVGGSCAQVGSNANAPCGATYAANRKDTIFARIDDNNNIVAETGGVWQFTTAQMDPVRRRAVSFGYNGYIYSLAGYSGSDSLQDLLFSKIDVSTGDIGAFSSSGVVVTPRWDLRAIVSNGYVYAVGGCGSGAAPGGCSDMQEEIQTFQLYNNDSGAPAGYGAGANLFTTDRIGASATIYNGYIYVAGGCTSSGDCTTTTNSVQYAAIDANGVIGAWSAGGNLPAARAWGELESVGGTLYYIGGQPDSATDERSEVYYTTGISSGNPTWNGTAATNGLPSGRTKHSATVWNNRIYVTGGLDTSAAAQSSVYISPQLNSGGNITTTWSTSGNSFNVARSGTTAIAYANNLYVIGGLNGSSNYLSDVQYTQINSDGTIDPWSYSTSLPEGIAFADGFAANGYMYLIGGRTSATACESNTLVAPISANTTIASGNNPTGVGEWYETNARYSGNRYGAAVAYSNGKAYVLGGGCGASITYTGANRVVQTALYSQPQIAKYSRMIDTDTDVFPTKWLMNGIDNSIGARWQMRYRSMTDIDGVTSDCVSDMTTWGQETNFGNVTLGQPENYLPLNAAGTNTNCARYFYFYISIDSSQTFGYPEDVSRGPTIADLSLFFTSDPSKRLRHGKTFTGGEQQPLDTPF